MDQRPIGMFDSGFGGLTVARAVIDLLPNENLVYFGDTGRYPYGSKPQADVAKFAIEIAEHLVAENDVKLLVVACNTAAAAAFDELTARLPIPVIGVVRPGVRSLAAVSRTRRVAVIGTVGAIDSMAYENVLAELDDSDDLELTTTACPGFVEFVERGETSGREVELLARRLLAPVVESDVDALLLGCTHYPFLARTISDVVGPDVVLVSSADETAFEVAGQLAARDLERSAEAGPVEHRFISSGDIAWFADLGRRLLGPELARAEPHKWH